MSKLVLAFAYLALVLLAFYAVPLLLGAIAGAGKRVMQSVWGGDPSERKEGKG